MAWLKIAEAQMQAGKSGNYQDRKYFDNSIRGLPFHVRAVTDASLEKLKQHIYHEDLPHQDFEGMFYAGDTQDDRVYYIIGAIAHNANVYILKAKTKSCSEKICR